MGAAIHKVTGSEPGRGFFPDPLRGITVEQGAMVAAQREHFLPGLEHAAFVVRGHDCHKARPVGGEDFFEGGQVGHSLAGHGDFMAAFRKMMQGGLAHAGMFHRAEGHARDPAGRGMGDHRIVGLGGS